MKLFHASDLHYAPSTLDEVDRCFGFAVDVAVGEECDAAVITGDIFDHRVELHSPCVAALLRQVHRLAGHMPVLILQGTFSHDAPGSLDVFKTLAGKHPVAGADRICQVLLTATGGWVVSESWQGEFDGASPRAIFSCLPSINKAGVAAVCGTQAVGEAVGEHIHNLLTAWRDSNEAARQVNVPTVVLSHGTVSGSITEHGVPMAGLDHEYTVGSLFAAGASAVCLGHIHQHQEWEQEGRRVAYPGSIGRLHFGEVQPKGFLIWNVEADGADCRFIETPAKRLVQIEFPGAPDMDELKTLAAAASDAHVRIRYVLDEEHRHGVDKAAITALFAAAAEVKIEARINPIQRTRAEGMYRAQTLADKLAKWCEVTQTDPAPLTERLAVVGHKDPEAIVADILGETRREAAA